ncbi:sugar-binding protein [Pedobacter kyonggii]|uniref:Carbohydrate-binding domain-containing protein n=1 Tax=Pedobacter kyonggii TaxID=1926871 RepID=A0A4Q9HGH3_9SPHI|nr:sugar-binding protein [Pedobacter kyonggii]TBO44307.1 hypothetical protein EYS08_03060 [Pedobacter kyonggii]
MLPIKKIKFFIRKANIVVLLVLLAIVAVFSFFYNNKAKLEVKKVRISPLIDGIQDDLWNETNWTMIERSNIAKFGKSDLSARFKVLYDNNNFYFLFDVTDDIRYRRPLPKSALEARYNFFCPTKDVEWPDKNDCIIVSFDTEKAHEVGSDRSFMFVYDYDVVTKAGTIDIIKEIRLRQKKYQGGYIMEISMPFKLLDLTPDRGISVISKVTVIDNDGNIILPYTMPRSSGFLTWGNKGTGRFVLID